MDRADGLNHGLRSLVRVPSVFSPKATAEPFPTPAGSVCGIWTILSRAPARRMGLPQDLVRSYLTDNLILELTEDDFRGLDLFLSYVAAIG